MGFPVSIPNSGSSDWNAIPFETVKHIEVVRGPASSVYGHNSMGGQSILLQDQEVDLINGHLK